MLNIRPSQVIIAGAGVVLFDLIFCRVIAPKVFDLFGLAPNSNADRDCHCAGKCGGCAWQKNITDRSQLIDLKPFTDGQMIRLPDTARRMV